MIYNETGSGGVGVRGCGAVSKLHIYELPFSTGDILYSLAKAKRGVMYKVVIKEIVPCKIHLTQGLFTVLYRDTLNALWNESDLVGFAQARAEAIQYWQDLAVSVQNLAKKC